MRSLTRPGDAWYVTVQHGRTEKCRRHHQVQADKSPDTAETTVSNMPGDSNTTVFRYYWLCQSVNQSKNMKDEKHKIMKLRKKRKTNTNKEDLLLMTSMRGRLSTYSHKSLRHLTLKNQEQTF